MASTGPEHQHENQPQTHQQPSLNQPTTNTPLRHTSCSNYTSAETASAKAAAETMKIHIADGRRNSLGEEVPSPVETWKPNFARKQSWNQEDMKREFYMTELEKNKKGQGGGFSEGGEGTRNLS